MLKRFTQVFIALCLGALLGCSGGKSDPQPGAAKTSLAVTSVSPSDSAVGIVLGTNIVASFDNVIDSITASEVLFSVKDQVGNPVTGSTSWSGTSATFAPAESLALGVKYTATIDGASSSGSIPLVTPRSWNFSTRDGIWSSSAGITTGPYSSTSPKIAIDGSGNGLAVWSQSDGMLEYIWTKQYTQGSGWGTSFQLQDQNAGPGEQPEISMNQSGDAVVAWVEADPSGTRHLVSRKLHSAQMIGAPVQIDSSGAENVSDPMISVNVSGVSMAVWHQTDGTSNEVWANIGTTTGWGTPIRLDNRQSNALWPEVVLNDDGSGIAMWEQRDNMLSTTTSVWISEYKPASGWGSPIVLPDGGLGYSSPRIATNGAGTALVVGTDWSGTFARVKAVWYSASQGFGQSFVVENVAQDMGFADVSMDKNGNAVVTWLQWNGALPYRTWAKRFSGQQGWGTSTLVDGGVGSGTNPHAAIDQNGNVSVFWERVNGQQYSICTSRSLLGADFTSPVVINSGTDVKMDSEVVTDRKGRAIIIWETSPVLGNIPSQIQASAFE